MAVDPMTGARVVSGKTMAKRPSIAGSVLPTGKSGKTIAARPGAYINTGDVQQSPPTAHGSITSLAVGTDPSRFGGHNAYSNTPWPVYGPADTGDMPNVQRAFAAGKENSGVTQLLPNVQQTSTVKGGPVLTTPQLSRVTGGQKAGFTPGEIVNIMRESQNQLQQTNDARTQAAMDYQQNSMGTVRNLYQDAGKNLRNIGRQAYDRIGEQENQNLAGSQANLISRGLGNSTVTDTVGHLYRREANDARQGVDEMKAQQYIGLDQNLANMEQGNAGRIGQYLTGSPVGDNSQQAIAGYGQAKASNNIAKELGLSGASTMIGGAAGGAGSALGSLAGSGIGAIGGLIAGLF